MENNKFKVLENELIPVMEDDLGNKLVSGRDLHEFLEIKTEYAKWFMRMTSYGFIINKDYVVYYYNNKDFSEVKNDDAEEMTVNQRSAKGIMTDHIMKLNMAKEVAMIQRNEKGKRAREYFIKVEEKYKQIINTYKLPQTFSEALRLLADEVDKNTKLTEENKIMLPKADTYDKIMKSETTFAMGDIAKIINYKGMGRNNLFKFLREQGVLMDKNRPYQRYVDSGYFKEVEHDFTKESGEVIITYQTVVFQKGLDFIIKLLDKNGCKVREDESKNDNIIELKKIINN